MEATKGERSSRIVGVPELSLPKGGGAIRGLGDKVTVGPTGSPGFRIPFAVSPSRSVVGTPELAIGYDANNGNGIFGLGWSLGLPAITRKTDKALPRYEDDVDLYVAAGVEDLVPSLVDAPFERAGARVDRYRPRIEGGFIRIERLTDLSTGDVWWQTTSRDNVTTVYGRSAAARVADPADPRRVFRWSIEEVSDDKGNIISFLYQPEDDVSVDLGRCDERNRRCANTYLKRVRYGNQTPFAIDRWHFEIVFDYGDHDPSAPGRDPSLPWPARSDSFSSFRAGFDVRTRRLCRRVLVFHLFDEPKLVRATELTYDEQPTVTTLTRCVQRGYADDGSSATLPPIDFGYTQPVDDPELQVMSADALENVPSLARVQWLDLDSEGLTGLLSEQAHAWYYKRNLGDGRLGPLELVAPLPRRELADAQLVDLARDGHMYLVDAGGYYRRNDDGWSPYVAFPSLVAGPKRNRFQRMLDLDGDGIPDILVSEDEVWRWHPSLGVEGYGPYQQVGVTWDEELGPALVFADPTESIFLADLSGDGLVDLVRVRAGEICYWPNLGYGRFGAKVAMANAPQFDAPDRFDPRRVRFADVDGTGPSDLVYAGTGVVTYWLNESGNGWSEARRFDRVPIVDNLAAISAIDLRGNGTSCIVWSSTAPIDAPRSVAYLDLMGGQKPHLLASVTNNLGATSAITYAPSTRFYVEDREAGTPWVTRIPFPVQVVAQIEVRDSVTGTRFVSSYSYHHGYYDGPEMEFRGFGRVEQLDTENYAAFAGGGLLPSGTNLDAELHVPPVLTKTWYHTGAYLDGTRISTQLAHEYWAGDALAPELPDSLVPDDVPSDELVEAVRALKGSVLRTEVYALDDSPTSGLPYTVATRRYQVVREQPRGDAPYAVFFAHPLESIELHYDRTGDPRISHAATLAVDAYGNTTQSISVAYPRRGPLYDEQHHAWIAVAESDVANEVGDDAYRIGVPVETRRYEITPSDPVPAQYSFAELVALAALAAVPFDDVGVAGTRRILDRAYTLYYTDDLAGPAARGAPGLRALTYQSYRMAFTPALVASAFGGRVTDAMLSGEGRYVQLDGAWWVPSSIATPDPAAFYLTVRVTDPFGNAASIGFDAYNLIPIRCQSSDDPQLASVTTADIDYRILAAWQITDANGNRSQARFDALGLVVATALMGKAGGPVEGDTLDDPTTRFEYDLSTIPAWSHSSARELHGSANTRWFETYEYSDGLGRVVQNKTQAEPDPQTHAARWIGSGGVVFDNKGHPIKQYEPFFSVTSAYQDEAALVASGVTAIAHYDPIGRLARTDFPDGTHTVAEFAPWQQTAWDRNDTVLASAWYAARIQPSAPADEQRAATLAAAHANTPAVMHTDTLGRVFLAIGDNGPDGTISTRTTLDIDGRSLAVHDDLARLVTQVTYDMLGRACTTHTLDTGDRWKFVDIAGASLRSWDSRGFAHETRYDLLRRRTHHLVASGADAAIVVERICYGEHVPAPEQTNVRGRVVRLFDGAGVTAASGFDFKGNPLGSTRRFAKVFDAVVDWNALVAPVSVADVDVAADPSLELEPFAASASFDAMNRTVRTVSPDHSAAIISYNGGALLASVEVGIRGAAPSPFVSDLEYDAHRQRVRIGYGNGVATTFAYDPFNFRLVGATTTRGSDGKVLQAVTYTDDPCGHIVSIDDAAQQTIYFANAVVPPRAEYTYDALYRLRTAVGREHVGLAVQGAIGPDDGPRVRQPSPGDGSAMQRYTDTYTYDTTNNPTTVAHAATRGAWTRAYTYAPGSNQLVTTGPGESYSYDPHGNMLAMPHLAAMRWDYGNRLASVELVGGGTAYYVYDGGGRRVRKVVVGQNGAITERSYLGCYEVYRERDATGVSLERQTLHVVAAGQRVAIVDTLVIDNRAPIAAPAPAPRFQIANHLASSLLELDETGALVSYEEYYPYGATSYQAGRNTAETSLKRYRFLGCERDDETGLDYMTARYYASWLGRWTAADPIGVAGGLNLYCYADCNPVMLRDPHGTDPNDGSSGSSAGNNDAAIQIAKENEEAAAIEKAQREDARHEAQRAQWEAERAQEQRAAESQTRCYPDPNQAINEVRKANDARAEKVRIQIAKQPTADVPRVSRNELTFDAIALAAGSPFALFSMMVASKFSDDPNVMVGAGRLGATVETLAGAHVSARNAMTNLTAEAPPAPAIHVEASASGSTRGVIQAPRTFSVGSPYRVAGDGFELEGVRPQERGLIYEKPIASWLGPRVRLTGPGHAGIDATTGTGNRASDYVAQIKTYNLGLPAYQKEGALLDKLTTNYIYPSGTVQHLSPVTRLAEYVHDPNARDFVIAGPNTQRVLAGAVPVTLSDMHIGEFHLAADIAADQGVRLVIFPIIPR